MAKSIDFLRLENCNLVVAQPLYVNVAGIWHIQAIKVLSISLKESMAIEIGTQFPQIKNSQAKL